ncbi:MAG: universal stress protein [Desulfosarcina sp.]|nr:universal stress protein [Desulfobacterales bacterium]
MYKKILVGTCLTDYCSHIFNFALNMARENGASLWIYHGLGRLNTTQAGVEEKIKAAEARVAEAYVGRMKEQGFTDYMINVSDGDVVSEMAKLARNAGIEAIVMGTSTETPIAAGESVKVGSLGDVATEISLWSPCPVIWVPPALIPGLARG